MKHRTIRRTLVVLLWLALAAYPLVDAWSYYMTPLTLRPDHPLHDLYRPTGLIGHGLGIIGSFMILIGVASYMIRKRWTLLHRWGHLSQWLSFHIFMCTLGPFFVLLHTTFKVGNIVSIAFWSMVIVVVSGIFGRYVHAHIPKFEDGHFYTEGDIRRAQARILREVAEKLQTAPEHLQTWLQHVLPQAHIQSFGKALFFALQADFTRARRHRMLRTMLQRTYPHAQTDVLPLLERYTNLELQRAIILPLQRAFGYWHTLHIPLAATMFLILIIHVGVAIAFGYTWIF